MQNSPDPTMGPQLAIQCENVGIYYPPANNIFVRKKRNGGFWALRGVSFDVNKGDILGIVGANGAGKSTILSVIGRIIAPNTGSVNTFDHSAMLLTINAGLSPNLTGRKNIILSGLTLGISKKTIEEKMDEIIAFASIGEFIDKPVNTYSTGMKSRLGFSTAIYLEPEIFLIDEALGVGDQDFRKKSSEAIKKKLSKNVTAVVVSHNERTIKELCNRALLMEHGQSTASGTPDEIFKIYNGE